MPRCLRTALLSTLLFLSCRGALERDYYLSTDGDDAADGTQAKPFKSVARLVEALSGHDCNKPIVAHVKSGTYEVPKAVSWVDACSPDAGGSITIKGEGDVVFTGGSTLDASKVDTSGALWRISGPSNAAGIGLELAGQRTRVAIEPDDRFTRTRAQDADPTRVLLLPTGLPTLQNPSDAWVRVYTQYEWWASRARVGTITSDRLTLDRATTQFAQKDLYKLVSGLPFVLENDPALADEPGEYAYQPSTGQISFKAPSGAMPASLRLSTTPTLLSFSNSHHVHVENVTLTNTAYQPFSADGGATDTGAAAMVDVNNSSDITFTNVTARNVGMDAFLVRGTSSGVQLQRCTIEDVGYSAFAVLGGGQSLNGPVNGHHVVADTTIARATTLVGSSRPINIFDSASNRFERLHVSDSYTHCLSMSATPFSSMPATIDGQAVTFENNWDFNRLRDNVVKDSLFERCMTASSDGAGIYVGGSGRNNVIEHNIVRNVGHVRVPGGSAPLFHLVYFDDGTSFSTIRGNLLTGIVGERNTSSGPIFVKGVGNTVEGNIVDASNAGFALANWHMFEVDDSYDLTIQDNVFVGTADTRAFVFRNWQANRVKKCDHNLFFNGGSRPFVDRLDFGFLATATKPAGGRDNMQRSVEMMPSWSVDGVRTFDLTSRIADPQLKPDFTWPMSSPAAAMGLTAFDASTVGPR